MPKSARRLTANDPEAYHSITLQEVCLTKYSTRAVLVLQNDSPGGGTSATYKPVGSVWVAKVLRGGETVSKFEFERGRAAPFGAFCEVVFEEGEGGGRGLRLLLGE